LLVDVLGVALRSWSHGADDYELPKGGGNLYRVLFVLPVSPVVCHLSPVHVLNSGHFSKVCQCNTNVWYGPGESGLATVIYPNCNSNDLKKVSLIHAAGVYESRGRWGGLFLGSSHGTFFARYRGTNQSRLSAIAAPPMSLPYASPAILWFIGFFILMAFAGRGKLSTLLAFVSVVYIFLLPATCRAVLQFRRSPLQVRQMAKPIPLPTLRNHHGAPGRSAQRLAKCHLSS
jgi:hypothetical protein